MRLHWHPFSIFPRRIRIALHEKAIRCEEVLVDLPGGATRSAEFRRLNPFGQVPVLEDGDLVLYESVAILEYLEDTHPTPPLLPRDPVGRARTRQLMLTAGDHLAPAFKRWVMRFFTPEGAWDRDDQARAVDEIGTHLDVLEAVLGDRDYLVGPFTLADVCYAPFACELDQVALGHVLVARPRVRAWVDRLNARPSLSATRPALPS
jgi:glutathione S-transferase